MPSETRTLFRRLAALALPLVVLLALYVVLDPFQIMRRDTDYQMRHGVAPNREVMSTEILLERRSQTLYDAFILGNSRSLAFHTPDWLDWIRPATPFHYDASAETLLGLRGKLQVLERERIPLRHALIVLDHDLLQHTLDTADIVTIKHPAVSGGSRLRFHAVFLKAFFSDLFFVKYLDYRLFGTWRPYMTGAIDRRAYGRNAETNDIMFVEAEAQIASDPDRFYAPSRWQGIDRTPRDAEPVIGNLQFRMLQEVSAAFVRLHADYQIVVSPDFGRVRLNPSDVAILRDLFGAERVHDFSRDTELGVNIRDWYETAHYRPHVAREIMRHIYGRD